MDDKLIPNLDIFICCFFQKYSKVRRFRRGANGGYRKTVHRLTLKFLSLRLKLCMHDGIS